MKLEWMEEHWEADDVEHAGEWIKDVMAQYAQHIRLSTAPVQPRPAIQNAAGAAAASLLKGRTLLKSLGKAPRRSSSTSSLPDTPYTPPATPIARTASGPSTSSSSRAEPSLSTTSPIHPAASITASPAGSTPDSATSSSAASSQGEGPLPTPLPVDIAAASLELSRYSSEGLYEPGVDVHGDEIEVDLLRYWEEREHQYPLLFRVALDVLPAQASAVPCEEVFSSSKETVTDRRTKMSPELLSELQMLKHAYRQDRLSFTDHVVANEGDYALEGDVTDAAARELLAAGKFSELADLLANA